MRPAGAALMTALEDDKILPVTRAGSGGASAEDVREQPVLTVAQVFELAEQVGRRPVGNIRKVPSGYRLRFCRHGEMRTSPEIYATRAEEARSRLRRRQTTSFESVHPACWTRSLISITATIIPMYFPDHGISP